jgi:hypothetical protein
MVWRRCRDYSEQDHSPDRLAMGYRFFIAGSLLLLIGIQLRMVDSFVLTPKATQFVEDKMQGSGFSGANLASRRASYEHNSLLLSAGPRPTKSVRPPRWLGLAALSVGAIFVFHGLTIRNAD